MWTGAGGSSSSSQNLSPSGYYNRTAAERDCSEGNADARIANLTLNPSKALRKKKNGRGGNVNGNAVGDDSKSTSKSTSSLSNLKGRRNLQGTPG